MITVVGVTIPARNERTLITACLRAVRRALDRVAPTVRVQVCVVAHRCTDGTERVVRAQCQGWPDADLVTAPPAATIGEVREFGVRHLLRVLGDHDPARVLLLHTDADTVVPPEWVAGHLKHVRAGAHAVAGLVDLAGVTDRLDLVQSQYIALVDRGIRGRRHDHVYGANLGVRADAHLAVGGFAPVASGEDRDLWRRLAAHGCRLATPTDLRVRTSARLRGRAEGGLADLLASLHDPAPEHGA